MAGRTSLHGGRGRRMKEEDCMILLIAGASHTGKTKLAQTLCETYHFPYMSIDLLKMGLIRSGRTSLTPADDDALTGYLWPIVREMIKTAIENQQHWIVEGAYIPFDWAKDFTPAEQRQIHYRCLVMTRRYIDRHFDRIERFANVIEQRLDDTDCTKERLFRENAYNAQMCRRYNCPCIWIDEEYRVEFAL